MTQGLYISVIPSSRGYFMLDSHSRNSSVKADPKGSAILLRFQNVVDLAKYIIDTYRLGCSVQYEIQQRLVESNCIPEEEKRRAVSAHKYEYQYAVILDNQNKRKRGRQAQRNSKQKKEGKTGTTK